MAEKLLRAAHHARVAAGGKRFVIDPALATSMGLTSSGFAQLLRLAGFQPHSEKARAGKALAAGVSGPPDPPRWRWRPARQMATAPSQPPPRPSGAFAALAELVR
jgi:ATP-dependent RNA helicase SUPV3L1/SUV3